MTWRFHRMAATHLLVEHRWFVATRRGFLLILPLVMIGAISLMASELPWPAWQALMTSLLGDGWREHVQLVGQASFGVMSLCLVATISHTLAGLRNPSGAETNPISVSLVAMISYLVLVMPANGLLGPEETGSRGTFLAVFAAIAATELFLRVRRMRRLQIGWLADADPQLPDTLRAILPAIVTVSIFMLCHELLYHFSAPADALFDTAVFKVFGAVTNDLLRALLFSIVAQVLWFFGVHGVNMLESVNQTWFDAATQANANAVMLGNAPYEIVTKPFIDAFVMLGGSGATTGLLIALFIASRSGKNSNSRNIAKLALLPAVFNINEILLFGLPIVLNPVFLLPFLLTPLLLTVLAYAALNTGLVPLSIHSVSWTTPLLANAWLATDSWRGIALQIVNLALSTVIYLPFVRIAERRQEVASQAVFRSLIDSLEDFMGAYRQRVVGRHDAIGRLARQLLSDIETDLHNGRVYLAYQPKLDGAGRVTGVEALLRWRHAVYGTIPPNIIVGIAEDAGNVGELGRWTLATACAQLAQWKHDGVRELGMAVNLSPLQLADAALIDHVKSSLDASGLLPAELELEITESRSVGNDPQSHASISALNALGVSLAMDDFGMGYSSLLYMRRFRINAIKLDGSLTREVESNASCRDIIMNVAQLCHTMGVRIVAEYVETESQSRLLQQLGCEELQGYLYSAPLPPDACRAFILARQTAPATSMPTVEV